MGFVNGLRGNHLALLGIASAAGIAEDEGCNDLRLTADVPLSSWFLLSALRDCIPDAQPRLHTPFISTAVVGSCMLSGSFTPVPAGTLDLGMRGRVPAKRTDHALNFR